MKELEAEQLVHARAAQVKKEAGEDGASLGLGNDGPSASTATTTMDGVSENLRTVQFEVR